MKWIRSLVLLSPFLRLRSIEKRYYFERRPRFSLHRRRLRARDNALVRFPYPTNQSFCALFFIYPARAVSKARHRGDILEFTIKDNNHLAVSGAIFNLFVRGEDWIDENKPNLLKDRHVSDSVGGEEAADVSTGGKSAIDDVHDALNGHRGAGDSGTSRNHASGKSQLSISINRFVHRGPVQPAQSQQQPPHQQHQQPPQQSQQQAHQKYTRTDSNYIGEIPKGVGEWKQFNITLMVNDWTQQQRHQPYDSNVDIVQEIVIKTAEPWMRQLLVLDTNSSNVSVALCSSHSHHFASLGASFNSTFANHSLFHVFVFPVSFSTLIFPTYRGHTSRYKLVTSVSTVRSDNWPKIAAKMKSKRAAAAIRCAWTFVGSAGTGSLRPMCMRLTIVPATARSASYRSIRTHTFTRWARRYRPVARPESCHRWAFCTLMKIDKSFTVPYQIWRSKNADAHDW